MSVTECKSVKHNEEWWIQGTIEQRASCVIKQMQGWFIRLWKVLVQNPGKSWCCFFSKMLSRGAIQPFENGTIQFSCASKIIYGIRMISDRM